jgi:hypothetical protein
VSMVMAAAAYGIKLGGVTDSLTSAGYLQRTTEADDMGSQPSSGES